MSIFISLLSGFGQDGRILNITYLSTTSPGIGEVLEGQVWRLMTPAFIHFGIYHLVFNLLWVWVCGSVIERKQGSLLYLLIFAVASSLSNLAQFAVSGPAFGGMSGVVYALIGYLWMQMQFNPIRYTGSIPKAVIPLMLIWFVICWLGIISNVANVAHTVGLVVGITWGRVHAMIASSRYSTF